MTEPTVSWRQFQEFSGPFIAGIDPIEPPKADDRHVARAFWLTTKVETGAKFGAVVMYDGTAVTGGPDQHVAVYPRYLADNSVENDQGGLWKLLRRMEYAGADHALQILWEALKLQGWYVAQDGKLRYVEDHEGINGHAKRAGDLVWGNEIRDVLTPTRGKVPKTGPEWQRSRDWAMRFHHALVSPVSRRAQVEFGMEHLVERTKSRRIELGDGVRVGVADAGYGSREISAIRLGSTGWVEDVDLAMCVYQSHSVNAPATANQALARARTEFNPEHHGKQFAKLLIQLLGNSTYGRWNDDLATGRYQRTRSAARGSGLWSRTLFDDPAAIMPKDLPG